MGLRVYQNPKCLQSSFLGTPHSLYHLRKEKKPPSLIPSWWSLKHLGDNNNNDCNDIFSNRLIYRSDFGGLNVSKVKRVKLACSVHSEDSGYRSDEETSEIEESSSKGRFILENHETLKPSDLGIKPETPSWPERTKMLRENFERKLGYLGIPISIKMIQKKLQLRKNLEDASEFTYCSVKKTFSSMVFMIYELQNYALQIRENLSYEDLHGLMSKIRNEIEASFVWLFEKVLWKTPSLMVYTMVLLANFTVFSMNSNINNTAFAATPMVMITDFQSEEESSELEDQAMNKDEKLLWKLMVEEAYRLQEESGYVVDKETKKHFIAPFTVELEGEDFKVYEKTKLYYQECMNWATNHSLVLANYAQFLYLFLRREDKAEEYFERSLHVEPVDPESYVKYADFLWLVRKNLHKAEKIYLAALDSDPGNSYFLMKYAYFLWTTGDDSTCFPTSGISDNFDPVS